MVYLLTHEPELPAFLRLTWHAKGIWGWVRLQLFTAAPSFAAYNVKSEIATYFITRKSLMAIQL